MKIKQPCPAVGPRGTSEPFLDLTAQTPRNRKGIDYRGGADQNGDEEYDVTEQTLPETRYAQSGDVNIAYQVMGDGRIDILVVPGLTSNVEMFHDLPGYTATLRRLAKFARVVAFDKRGQGLSDRISGAPSLEQRMDDVRAVMDEIGSRRVAILAFSEGGCMSALFAATYPERVSHLILFGSFSRAADLLPKGVTPDHMEARIAHRAKNWGNADILKAVLPSQAQDPNAVAVMARMERLSSTPGALKTIMTLNSQIDVSSILPAIQVPTLVLHRRPDLVVPVEFGRQLAAQISVRGTWNTRKVTTASGPAIPKLWSATSRNSSPATGMEETPDWSGSSRR
jgi:pimeloyl-ACP methyl ester carboxylesterase